MAVQILILLSGLLMVVYGADRLVDGASSLARRFGVSEFVIGLVIVGFGTSLPELVVSVTGAVEGNSAIAIGNVIGSNVFNTVFILALSALFVPVAITRENARRDIPVTIAATVLVLLLGLGGRLSGTGASDGLSRVEGLLLVVLFAAYIFWCFRSDVPDTVESAARAPKSTGLSVLLTVGGLACLVAGGRLFVDSAVRIATSLGVSDKYIAVTVLAMGTSLPELVTSLVALARKRSQMALGNILGSNVFNLLLILGTSALISPMSFASVAMTDAGVMLLSIILVWTGVHTGKKNLLDRLDAVLMLAVFAGYMVWLTMNL